MSDYRQTLIETAEAHCQRTGKSLARVATIVVNDGKFFDRIKSGGGCTMATFERFMDYFGKEAAASERGPHQNGEAA